MHRRPLVFSLCATLTRGLVVPARLSGRVTRFEPSDFPSSWPYTTDDMSRMDESADMLFYTTPRFVTHIDDGAIKAVTQFYDEVLPKEADVCDLCSSWISHLPDRPFGRVSGVGMNARELEANTRLTEFVQADLNVQPKLPFDDASFDACLNVVSVDYLTQPQAIFQEMHRVLRPDGQAIMSFSNRCGQLPSSAHSLHIPYPFHTLPPSPRYTHLARSLPRLWQWPGCRCFPTKAVKMWLDADDEQRQRIVATYFHCSVPGGWDDVTAIDISTGPPVPKPGESSMIDMMRSLVQGLVPSDPMFVVRATKKAS